MSGTEPEGQPRQPAGAHPGGRFEPSRRQEADRARGGKRYLDREQIERLFSLLDERLRARGVSAGLFVVGGAALAMGPMQGRLTADVDVASLDEQVAIEAEQLGIEEGLPRDWLNSSAAPWVPSRKVEQPDGRPGLTVVYAEPEQLLAMKIVAHRRRDAEDIPALAAELGMTGAPPPEFERLLRSVYGGEGELAQMVGGPQHLVDDEVRQLAEAAARLASRPPRRSFVE